MPRVNPHRSLANERNLARRIAYERESRTWSYEGLASRMGSAGFPMQASAIFKIEKGKPPRRITVDEMVGFATVFDVSTADLLVPVELLHENRLMELVREQETIRKQIEALVVSLAATRRKCWSLINTPEGTAAHRRRLAQVLDNLRVWVSSQDPDQRLTDALQESHVDNPWPEDVDRALHALDRAVDKWSRKEEADA